MAPVDPGRKIQWAKLPSYTTSLIEQLTLLPRDRAHRLFLSSGKVPQGERNETQRDLERVASALFTAVNEAESKSHRASVSRRLLTLIRLFSEEIMDINTHESISPNSYRVGVQELTSRDPWSAALYNLLHDHPDVLSLSSKCRKLAQAQAQAHPEPQPPAAQGVNANAIAGPAPPYVPPPPPAPIAGPPPAQQIAIVLESDDDEDDDDDEVAILDPVHHDPMQGIEFYQAQQLTPPLPVPPSPPLLVPPPLLAAPPPFPSAAAIAIAAPNPNLPHDDSDLPTHCFKCNLLLSPSPALAEAHMDACFNAPEDVGAGAYVSVCPVCDEPFSDEMDTREKEGHVARCVEGGGKKGINRSENFYMTASEIPKGSDGEEDCTICFEPFELGDLSTRLQHCNCVFHSSCISSFWRSEEKYPEEKRRFCTVH